MRMTYGKNTEFLGLFKSVVAAGIIHQNDFLHIVMRNFVVSVLKRLGRVISRHNDFDLFALKIHQFFFSHHDNPFF